MWSQPLALAGLDPPRRVAELALPPVTGQEAAQPGQEGGQERRPRSVASEPMELPHPIDVLPHRPPFLFVTAVTGVVPGHSAAGALGAQRGRSSSPATFRVGPRCRAC